MPSPKTRSPIPFDLRDRLVELGLRGVAAATDDLLAAAAKGRWGPVQLLEELCRTEANDRARRGLERRRSRSRVGAFKPMVDFDWDWPTSIPRDLVERVLALEFLADGGNVVLVGAHGLGKTMMLKNLAHEATVAGHSALFVTAAQLLNDLAAQETPRALERRIKHYLRFALLAIDELGYLSYDARAADLLFEVVSRRHDRGRPIALTTNLAFADWPHVFPNAASVVALVDRLTHRADVIKITGDSWRRKESEERRRHRAANEADDAR